MYGPTREALYTAWQESERRAAHAQSMPGVLRASGVRIEPTTAERLRALTGQRQQWQGNAWGYRDMIGELRFALRFRANAISRAKFFIAQVDPDSEDDEPLPVSLRDDRDDDGKPTEKSKAITLSPAICDAAEEELRRLPLADGYGFLGVWSENFDVTGECYLHGYTDRWTQAEVWKIRSVDDVDVQGSGVTVKDELGQPRRVNLETEELYRLWVPHPRRGELADSPLNACMDVLEDITLVGRELRAAARSRIMTNGVVLVPDGMVRVKNVKGETDKPEDRSSRFMADFTGAMLAPIMNEGDAGAVVPMVLTGTREDIEAFRHVRFEREDSPALLLKLEKALGRLAASIDIPPEILTGMAEVNHWTAWQIDAATFKQYLEPAIRLMVDALTSAQMRAALTKRGFSAEEIARVRIWYNADSITENPNRRQDALDARDRNAISDKAFRDALGFGEGDAPTPDEVMLMIAGKTGFDQQAAAAILQWAARQAGGDMPPLPAPLPAQQIGPAQPPPAPAQAPPDPAGTGGTGAPPAAVAASARPMIDMEALAAFAEQERARKAAALADQLVSDLSAYADQRPLQRPAYRLDTATARQLMEIERALRDRIMDAADGALTRARDRAGNRFRSKATKDPAIAASLRDYATWDWPRQVGRQQCLALGADSGFLLAQAWEELSGKFARWVLAAIDRMLPGVLKLSGRDPRSTEGRAEADRIRAEMTARIDPAWDRLQGRLDALADAYLFQEEPGYDPEGEVPDVAVPPYLVRAALAEVGGLPEDSPGYDERGRPVAGEPARGLATGSTISRTLADAGVAEVGYLWVYGITPLRNQFEPHVELEGHRFTSWFDDRLKTDERHAWVGEYYRTGDHTGCMCDFVPGYAVPDYAQQVRDRLTVPPPNMTDILALADSDDQAGRTGTTAQATRDQYLEIQKLQARFLEGE
jgi:hypothetical protein